MRKTHSIIHTKRPYPMSERAYLALVDADIGLCRACGEESEDYCEPDAREYHCSACGEMQVYGMEELLMRGEVEFL